MRSGIASPSISSRGMPRFTLAASDTPSSAKRVKLKRASLSNAVESAAGRSRACVDILTTRAGERADVEPAGHLPAASRGETGGATGGDEAHDAGCDAGAVEDLCDEAVRSRRRHLLAELGRLHV